MSEHKLLQWGRDQLIAEICQLRLLYCGAGCAYDAAGELTQDGTGTGTHTYQYDAEGRLVSVDNGTTASYVYNALGERAERNVSGTYTEYLYDKDGSEVGENSRTTWTETWAAFQGRHLFHFSGGSTYFTHMDSLGTNSRVEDAERWTRDG